MSEDDVLFGYRLQLVDPTMAMSQSVGTATESSTWRAGNRGLSALLVFTRS